MERQTLLERIDDLIVQATTENTHAYTANVLKEAAVEIRNLRAMLKTLL